MDQRIAVNDSAREGGADLSFSFVMYFAIPTDSAREGGADLSNSGDFNSGDWNRTPPARAGRI